MEDNIKYNDFSYEKLKKIIDEVTNQKDKSKGVLCMIIDEQTGRWTRFEESTQGKKMILEKFKGIISKNLIDEEESKELESRGFKKEISITTPEGETIKGVIDWNKFHKEKNFIDKLEQPLINIFKNQEQIIPSPNYKDLNKRIEIYNKPFPNNNNNNES